MAKPTMDMVAARAGVSLASVSRAIHRPDKVSPATRARIEAAMAELDYVYNAVAGDLSRRQSNLIGVIIPTTRAQAFAQTLLALQEQALESGHYLLIGGHEYDPGTEARLLHQCRERRVAGLISTGPVGQEWNQPWLGEVPRIRIWDLPEDEESNYVGFDNFRAVYKITKYLIDLGHSSLGLIIGPYESTARVGKRFQGFRSALAESGLEFKPGWIGQGRPGLAEGYRAMTDILAQPRRPSGVICAGDSLALGAMAAAREQDLTLPRDLSIIGLDDVEMAGYAAPPLTSLHVPATRIGLLAFEGLLGLIKGTEERVRIELETEIVVRRSCAPPNRL